MQQHIYITILSSLIIFSHNCNLKNTNSQKSLNSRTTDIASRQDSIEKIENSVYPIHIDKKKEYEEKKITRLQDIGKVEYIKLETNDNCLMRASYRLLGVFLTDKYIFISTGDNVLQFDKNGKFINSIGKKGSGPMEIVGFSDFFVDDEKKEIHILDGTTQNLKIFEYNGELKNTIYLDKYGDDIGLIDNNSIIYSNFLANNLPMVIQSTLIDGKISKEILPARTEKDATGLSTKFWDKFTKNYIYNNKIIYQNFINDTIYMIDKKSLIASPRYIQLPPNTGLDGNNSSPFVSFETDRYAYILICRRPPFNHNYFIDKKENKIYKGFIGDNNLGIPSTPINSNRDNIIVDLYDTDKLIDRLAKNKLRGTLKEIAETLDEEDNPVLMIATINF